MHISGLLMMVVSLVFGLGLLAWAADRFIESSIAIAEIFNMSPLLIGMVLVGFGTAFPELVVSALAAMRGEPGLSIGNVIGSNIANIGLCLGVTAMFVPLAVHSRIIKRDCVVLFVVTLFVGFFVLLGSLTPAAGIALLVALYFYLYWQFKSDAKGKNTDDALAREYEKEIPKVSMGPTAAYLWWGFSLVLIFVSSEILIRSAIAMAHWFHVSNLVIGLTVVAVGTSLPELAATLIAAKRGEDDIALGNVVGSNIFNLLGVLAMPALISPSTLAREVVHRDYPIMLGFTVLMWVFTALPPNKGRLGRLSGLIFFSAFVAYLTLVVITR